jgi:hypothetical protein
VTRPVKTGRVLESGVISAAKIAAGLGLGSSEALKEPEPSRGGKPMLCPAQQRAQDEGKPLPPDSPDYERTSIPGGRSVWEYLGQPDVFTPDPNAPDGTPVPKAFVSREHEEKREKRNRESTDWEKIDERQAARKLAGELEKARDNMKKLLRKEAEIEVARQKRTR